VVEAGGGVGDMRGWINGDDGGGARCRVIVGGYWGEEAAAMRSSECRRVQEGGGVDWRWGGASAAGSGRG
jgi:hypothetical protein